MTFSESVQKRMKNLFETNQFDDLSGLESAQKLLILARELGIPLMLDDIDVEAIADPRFIADWGCVDTSGVFEKEDAYYEKKVAEAKSKGCTLRYVKDLSSILPQSLENTSILSAAIVKPVLSLKRCPLVRPTQSRSCVPLLLLHCSLRTTWLFRGLCLILSTQHRVW